MSDFFDDLTRAIVTEKLDPAAVFKYFLARQLAKEFVPCSAVLVAQLPGIDVPYTAAVKIRGVGLHPQMEHVVVITVVDGPNTQFLDSQSFWVRLSSKWKALVVRHSVGGDHSDERFTATELLHSGEMSWFRDEDRTQQVDLIKFFNGVSSDFRDVMFQVNRLTTPPEMYSGDVYYYRQNDDTDDWAPHELAVVALDYVETSNKVDVKHVLTGAVIEDVPCDKLMSEAQLWCWTPRPLDPYAEYIVAMLK